MTVTLKIEGLDELEAGFDKLEGRFAQVMQQITLAVGEEVRLTARDYPARKYIPLGQLGGFVSDKQRRWFFAALRRGNIKVPRKRTDVLKNSWQVQRHGTMSTSVENPTPYAPFVHSPEQQSSMMQAIGWPTTQDIADKVERSGDIRRIAEQVLKRWLSKLGLG